MELCGETFEVHTSRMHPVAPITGCDRDEIFEAYGRPSQRKVNIWRYWCNWCEEMNKNGYKCGIEICSHSSNFFSISGYIRTEDETWDIYITYAHNRLYKYQAL